MFLDLFIYRVGTSRPKKDSDRKYHNRVSVFFLGIFFFVSFCYKPVNPVHNTLCYLKIFVKIIRAVMIRNINNNKQSQLKKFIEGS